MSDEKIRVFQEKTQQDNALQTLKKYIQEGWPENKADIPEEVKAYKGLQDELSEANELLFKG